RVGPDEDEEPTRGEPDRLATRAGANVDRLEHLPAVGGDDLAEEAHVDVRAGRELVDQVPRHAFLEVLTSVEDGDAACVVREEHRRLPGRVARTDDMDV